MNGVVTAIYLANGEGRNADVNTALQVRDMAIKLEIAGIAQCHFKA